MIQSTSYTQYITFFCKCEKLQFSEWQLVALILSILIKVEEFIFSNLHNETSRYILCSRLLRTRLDEFAFDEMSKVNCTKIQVSSFAGIQAVITFRNYHSMCTGIVTLICRSSETTICKIYSRKRWNWR